MNSWSDRNCLDLTRYHRRYHRPVIQQDRTGCGIASVAALANRNYATVKRAAAGLGIAVTDSGLWHDTRHVRRLLVQFRLKAGRQRAFASWEALPDCALLAIKWHREPAGPAWHWVVFVRNASGTVVLDPKKALRTNRRTDFGRMKPKCAANRGSGLNYYGPAPAMF